MACSEPQRPNREFEEEQCWQSSLSNPADRLAALYNRSRLTDLTITFPGHPNTIEVHRLILAMSSPVFECMLFGPMSEGMKLELPEDPPEAFSWLMGYIYCGTAKLPDVSIAVQVYHLASKYQMDALACLCSKFLEKKLTASNLPQIYDTASILEDSTLQNRCSEVVSKSADEVLSSSYIGQLSRNSMKHLLQQEFNVKSEMALFQGLLRWGTFQINKESQKSEAHNLREEIKELLPFVRFLTMTVEEFVERVMPSSVLTSNEMIAIQMNIKQVSEIPVPQICSRDRRTRRQVFDINECHLMSIHSNSRSMLLRNEMHNNAIISDMKVTTDIHLGGLMLTIDGQLITSNSTRIEITDNNGTQLIDKDVQLKDMNQCDSIYKYKKLDVTFDVPVLISSNKTYRISLDDISWRNDPSRFSIYDNNLIITGILCSDGNPDIYFWS